jgi:hypothetical protein
MERVTTCDITSGLIDLLAAPDGSKSFYSQMVPHTVGGSLAVSSPTSMSSAESSQEMTTRLVEHCLSYGLTRASIGQVSLLIYLIFFKYFFFHFAFLSRNYFLEDFVKRYFFKITKPI